MDKRIVNLDNMKVKDLIKALEQMPQEAYVKINAMSVYPSATQSFVNEVSHYPDVYPNKVYVGGWKEQNREEDFNG